MDKATELEISSELANNDLYDKSYSEYIQMNTDSSKNSITNLGIAFIVPEFHLNMERRFRDGLSIYSGEMLAMLLALRWIEETVVCSDSRQLEMQSFNKQTRPFDRITTAIIQNSNDGTKFPISIITSTYWNQRK